MLPNLKNLLLPYFLDRLVKHCFYGIRMGYKTFSCFQNFVQSNDLGVPDHTDNYNALRHLSRLLKTVFQRLENKQVQIYNSKCSFLLTLF